MRHRFDPPTQSTIYSFLGYVVNVGPSELYGLFPKKHSVPSFLAM